MLSDIRKNLIHYLVLFAWLSLGLLLFIFAREITAVQQLVVLLMASGYGLWGVLHHYLLHDLNAKIVLEYFLIAILSGILLIGAIQFQ